jgi:hypothetical protein
LAGWALFGPAWAQVEETVMLPVHHTGYFDKSAPTVTAEDVVEFREREGVVAQERRNVEREDATHKETTRRQNECFAAPAAAKASDAGVAQKPLRKDLEGKTLMELVQMQQQRPDPEIEAAMMQRAQADAAKVGMPGGASPLQALLGTVQRQGGPLDGKVAEGMRRQEQAANPVVQACLGAAEGKPRREEVKHTAFDSPAFSDAIDALRQGRIASVAVDIGDVFKTGDGRRPGHVQRFNVVLRGSERAGLAVPLTQADAASWRPNRSNWPALNDSQKLAELAAPEPAAPKKKPTADGFLKNAKDLFEQLKGVPR